MSDKVEDQTKTDKVGVDDIVEDAFGLNVRGLATLWTMFAHPVRAYAAARSPNWNDRSYTPSIRLVFSLMAVLTAVRFLWTSDESIFYQTVLMSIEQAGSTSFGPDLDVAAEALINRFVVLFPLTFIGLHIIGSALCFTWGKGTRFPERLRLYFLAIIPSTVFMVLLTGLMSFLTLETFYVTTAIVMFGSWLLDAVTALRGGIQADAGYMKIMKALVFASFSFTAGLAANFAAFIGAQIWFIYWPSQ